MNDTAWLNASLRSECSPQSPLRSRFCYSRPLVKRCNCSPNALDISDFEATISICKSLSADSATSAMSPVSSSWGRVSTELPDFAFWRCVFIQTSTWKLLGTVCQNLVANRHGTGWSIRFLVMIFPKGILPRFFDDDFYQITRRWWFSYSTVCTAGRVFHKVGCHILFVIRSVQLCNANFTYYRFFIVTHPIEVCRWQFEIIFR